MWLSGLPPSGAHAAPSAGRSDGAATTAVTDPRVFEACARFATSRRGRRFVAEQREQLRGCRHRGDGKHSAAFEGGAGGAAFLVLLVCGRGAGSPRLQFFECSAQWTDGAPIAAVAGQLLL